MENTIGLRGLSSWEDHKYEGVGNEVVLVSIWFVYPSIHSLQ